MKFKRGQMYKNLVRDKNMSFVVIKVLEQENKGADLKVAWYKETSEGKYASIGVDGEFYIPKSELSHYVLV